MKISVVIPVYHGEQTIEELYNQLQSFFQREAIDFEVIFVWDCGPDDSWQVISKLKSQHPDRITGIRLSRNFGQHNAIICGFELAKGDFVVTMDEDLQHSPADIKLLLGEQAKGNFDVVYGKYETRQHKRYRNVTSGMLKKLISVGIPDLHPEYSAFRLIKVTIARSCTEMSNSYTFLDGYLSWITKSFSYTTVSHQQRVAGKSAYSFKKLLDHSINIFVTFSNMPIRLLTGTAIIVFMISLVYSVYVVIRELIYDDFAAGFPSLIIAIGFGVSLMLLGLGVVGEYVYRLNLKTTKKPNYLKQEVI